METTSVLSLQEFAQKYLPHHFFNPMTPFQELTCQGLQELIMTTGSAVYQEVGLRATGKTTISTIALPLWCICYADVLGDYARHYIIIVTRFFEQSRMCLDLLWAELQNNAAILDSFGNLAGDNYRMGGRIQTTNSMLVHVVGSTRAMRGRKYQQWRPDLIVLDEIQDESSPSEAIRTGSPDLKLLSVREL